MSTDASGRWPRIEALFAAALTQDPASRVAFVEAATSDDRAIRAEVLALLRAHEATGAVDRLVADVAALATALRPAALEGRDLGRYRIEARVGGGGMGVVYRAHDVQLDRPVALKVLAAHLGGDPVAARRFRLEARTIATLEHPNICAIHEIGETDDGLLYLVMPLYEGETVQQVLEGGPLPVVRAIDIATQTLHGLGKAHARGIIHRDIKPSNVLLTPDGVVKLLDFGVVKLPDLTLTGTAELPIGTAAYMSPEQALGTPIDLRTDLWSVGVMLYEMLTGQRPYASGVAAALAGERSPTPLVALRSLDRDIPAALEAVVARALAQDPAARYQSAAEFEDALRASAPQSSGSDAARPVTLRTAGRRRRNVLTGVIAGLVLISATTWYATTRPPETPAAAAAPEETGLSIAVLPLVDRSAGGTEQYYADGLTEELIATLSRVDGLRVASSTSSFAYRGRTEDVRAIGTQLGVSHVVEGNLQRAGDELRIRATLVRVHDGFQVWSQLFRRPVGEAFAVQQDIAQAVARGLQVKLLIGTADLAMVPPDAAAYELYLKGRFAWGTRTEEGLHTALRFFELAVAKDSSHAPAWAGLADANAVLGFYDFLSPQEAFPRAEAAANRAIALDPLLAAPHATLGYVALYYHWDLARGEAEFKRALALDDSYATGHQWYGNLLLAAGRFEEAQREMQRAQEEDPLSRIATAAEGLVHYFAGDYAAAMARFRTVFATDPSFVAAMTWAGETLVELDSMPQAIAMHRQLVTTSDSSSSALAALARTLAVAGAAPEATLLLARLDARERAGQYVPAYDIAKIHVALGQSDTAFAWLRKARAQRSHSMMFLKVDPAFRTLRSDPAFLPLLSRDAPT
jgi:TolB-like protein/Tfp pilus assembly protein PilF